MTASRWSINVTELGLQFSRTRSSSYYLRKHMLPKAQLISRKMDGWQNKQNYIAGINKSDVSEVRYEATRGNSHKFQQGKFWLDENFTVAVVKQWNRPREAMGEFPPCRQTELQKVLGNVIHLWSQLCLEQEAEAATCLAQTRRHK